MANKVFGKIDKNKLQAFLGNTAYAMAPRSFGGKLGKMSSDMAMKDIEDSKKKAETLRKEQIAASIRKEGRDYQDDVYERGEPDREQARRVRELQIENEQRGKIAQDREFADYNLQKDLLTNKSSIGNEIYEVPYSKEDKISAMSGKGYLDMVKRQQDLEDKKKSIELKNAQIKKANQPTKESLKTPTLKKFNDGTQRSYNPTTGKWDIVDEANELKKKESLSEAVKEAEKAWLEDYISPDGARTTPTIRERLAKRQELITQEKAFNGEIEQVPRKDDNGNPMYISPNGDVLNYIGEKIGEVPRVQMMGIPNTLKKSH